MSKEKITDFIEIEEEMDSAESEHETEFIKMRANEGVSLRQNPFGFAGKDLVVLLNSAQSNNYISFYRPINKNAGSKIDLGTHEGKGINVKGKSSNFGPIAGEVPLDPRLSKLFEKETATEKPDYKHYYDEVTEQLWKSSEEEKLKILAAEVDTEEKSKAFLEKHRDYKPCKAVQKIVNIKESHIKRGDKIILRYEISHDEKDVTQEYDLFYFRQERDENSLNVTAEILSTGEERNRPIFAIKIKGEFFFLNSKHKSFSRSSTLQEAAEKLNATKVEVLAYVKFHFELINGKTVFRPKNQIITADYDELSSSGQKLMPIANTSKFVVEIDRELLTRNISVSELKANIIASHEIKKNKEFSTRQYFLDLGAITDLERALKVTQKSDTNSGTNHAAEIGNPNPEPFLDDDSYPVLIPNINIKNYVARKLIAKFPQEKGFDFSEFDEAQDSKLSSSKLKGFALKLHGETQIMFLFNLLRKIGYPLRVNPKWNWILAKEEPSKFLINPFDYDDNSEYNLPSNNKPTFRALTKRDKEIDWKKITDIIEGGKKSYKKSKEALIERIIKNFPKNTEKEASEFNEHLNRLFKFFELKMMNYVVKFRDQMTDLPAVESDDNADIDYSTTPENLAAEFSRLAPKLFEKKALTKLFKEFYSFTLNEKIQNQMLMISELESSPCLAYAWGTFLHADVSERFKTDKEYVRLIKNLGYEMSDKDKENVEEMLELSIQTGTIFENWRKTQIEKLGKGLNSGVKDFKKLLDESTQLIDYAQLISPDLVIPKKSNEQDLTASSNQKAASSSQRR